MNSEYSLQFKEIDKSKINIVGGKGANLGELARIENIRVPDGFCVTTNAFNEIVQSNKEVNALLHQLDSLTSDDRKQISKISAQIRSVVEALAIPPAITKEITSLLARFGNDESYAVRSSATAEDLPTASFAGQQDTYLNIIGIEAIVAHISKCWASLFTDRAVTYRIQNNFDHRKVSLSVVVQKMVFPEVSGIMFTADPISSNRKVLSIDASFGLGEALVSGIVNADNYKVKGGVVTDKKISTKKIAILPVKAGGTKELSIHPDQQDKQALSDQQILQLEGIGRTIEKHFGSPQDIEWCLVGDQFCIVQSRPITTLFPIPQADDEQNHVYISVGHQQMMTDAMKPLGLSFFMALTKATMRTAAGRLFVDVTAMLSSLAGRTALMDTAGKSDPLIKDALMSVIDRGDFIPSTPIDTDKTDVRVASKVFQKTVEDHDPSIVTELIKRSETSTEATRQKLQSRSGAEVFDLILADLVDLQKILFDPQSTAVFMTALNATIWINEKMNEWLGEKGAGDIISLSVPNNITSEMGLALLDVADAIRPFPKVIDYLQKTKNEGFLDELRTIEGGKEAAIAIQGFLEKYGMRCVGEIDITKTRWSERPLIVVPMILSNIRNFGAGESKRKFEKGKLESLKKEQELIVRLKQLPDGDQKAKETKRMIDLVRNFIGYREYPKYSKISRYFVYKQAIMREVEKLVQSGVIAEREDAYYLTLEELRDVVRNSAVDHAVIEKRKDEYKFFEKLTPPRVITSDGEILTGKYKHENIPAGAIAGLAVSAGTFEGRARVVLNIEDADLQDGDILVTSFTDPSWTPLFVSIKGLVTEVGGLMTHGAVIAREYGIPAVVGVENATKLIKDGQRIRVNGTDGFIEVI